MDTAGLLPFQIEPANILVEALSLTGAALDASDCGVGKTYHAAAVVRHLKSPTLVVCPKISVTSWNRVLTAMKTGACVKNYESLATGRTPYGSWEHPMPKVRPTKYVCEQCQQEVKIYESVRCRYHPTGIHCVSIRPVPHNYGKFSWYAGIKLLVFDEVHRCGGLDSLNADMLIAAKRQAIPTLCLSATAADSPLGFRALGYVLGLHSLVGSNGFFHWAMHRGCKRPVFGGLHFMASEERKKGIMAEIHRSLFPVRGARVRVTEIPGFPACQVKSELYDLDAAGKIDALYAEMDTAIAALNEMKKTDVCDWNPLTMLLRASQQIELLKVPLFIAIRDEAIEAGLSVAIFVAYTQTLEELMKRMKVPACIRGGQPLGERQHWIDEFQADRQTTIIANIAAGGVSVSLHDTLGRARLGIASLHPSAVKMRQVFGRLARAGGLSPALYRIPLVAGTVEEKTHEKLVSKLNTMDALNDADLCAANLPLLAGNLGDLLDP